jgi:predicted ABC-type ATPase
VHHAALDARPIIIALAGPNGAGKTTFYEAFLRDTGLRFVNADEISRQLGVDAYDAARAADSIRRELVAQEESFIFETVLSDPVGDKVAFLKSAASNGYTVVMCFIGIAGPDVSAERVAMRVSQGGHDVPTDKLEARYARSVANLGRAIVSLPRVLVYDNGDLSAPFRCVAEFEGGKRVTRALRVPAWLKGIA